MPQKLPGVELFASGVYRGKEYTPADIDRIVANCHTLGPKKLNLLDPPAVKGHEEEDATGNPTAAPERTDVPADGWVLPETARAIWKTDRLGRKQRVLIGDVEVGDDMAALIQSGKFRTVSAEIYDDFTDDHGKSYGKALRRVAFLGGEVPQVKNLADLPAPIAFAERRFVPTGGKQTSHGTFIAFAEIGSVATRQENIEAIKRERPGLLDTTLQPMTDDQLADFAKNPPSQTPAPATPGATTPMTPTREEMIAALVAAGGNQAELDMKPEEEIKALYDQLQAAGAPTPEAAGAVPMADVPPEEMKVAILEAGLATEEELATMTPEDMEALYEIAMGEPEAAPTPAATPAPSAVATMAEREARQVLARSRELNRQLVAGAAKLKRDRITAFCEKLVLDGRILPVQKQDYIDLLMTRPDGLRKFSDTGKPRISMLTEKMSELGKRQPIIRLGERVRAAGVAPDVRKSKFKAGVEKFSEDHATTIKATGKTPSKYVEEALAIFDKNPDLAEQTLPDHYKA